MEAWGIIVAAGLGRRFGSAKHVVSLEGVPLWQRAFDALTAAGLDRVVVVGDVPGGIPGGRRRRDSVAAGLAVVPDRVASVVVHDAARPLATPELARRVLAALREGEAVGVGGAIPVVAVRDTLKRVVDGRVVATVDRTELVGVQTPQAFRREVLVAAHRASDEDATDDAQLLERIGATVVAVAGDPANLKVTYPDDLAVAVALLRAPR